ncbi:hypothetical protein [Limnohabitans sp.]|uniref:hypothetical protein n=1 Tax=Limnohabitans sp. TaxID=1907725 RepID=UPI00286EB5AF|nr:hypothetical protein [Limnohabitans sp.]
MSWTDMTHAVLPQAVFLSVWVKLSWACVMSAVLLRLTYGYKPTVWPAAVVAVLMLLPRTDVLSGYLALALQTPSLVCVAWALGCWADVIQSRSPKVTPPTLVALLGVLLGWVLVVDTLNCWPAFLNLQLYALGFEAVALWLVVLVTAAVLLWQKVPPRWVLSAVAVLTLYVLLRLPTGNVWDALLDPFVWLALHVQLWRTWRASRGA